MGIIGLFCLIALSSGCSSYNSMSIKDETVSETWGNVQTQYQRRMDLIPNLVNIVKGYANFEKSTLTAVIEARANATKVTVDASKLESLEQYQAAQTQLSSALSRLMVVVEKYPDLKANDQFMALQAEVAGTENRINISRKNFNGSVKDYNRYIRVFPKNIWANAFGFEVKKYFESDAAAKNAPVVNF